MEIWKKLDGYDNHYEISNLGRLKSNVGNTKLLKADLHQGYLRYRLMKNGKQIKVRAHRLVAQVFLENSLNLPEVHHKNGNRLDNRVSNLEWIDRTSNLESRNFIGKKNIIRHLEEISKKFNIERVQDLLDHLKLNL